MGDNDIVDRVHHLEEVIANYQEALAQCTAIYNWKLVQVDEDDDDGRNQISELFREHSTKVNQEIEKKVIFRNKFSQIIFK